MASEAKETGERSALSFTSFIWRLCGGDALQLKHGLPLSDLQLQRVAAAITQECGGATLTRSFVTGALQQQQRSSDAPPSVAAMMRRFLPRDTAAYSVSLDGWSLGMKLHALTGSGPIVADLADRCFDDCDTSWGNVFKCADLLLLKDEARFGRGAALTINGVQCDYASLQGQVLLGGFLGSDTLSTATTTKNFVFDRRDWCVVMLGTELRERVQSEWSGAVCGALHMSKGFVHEKRG